MLQYKSLFNASFEEAIKICPNLFSKKLPLSYDLGSFGGGNIWSRILKILIVIAMSVMFYGFGGFLPKSIDTEFINSSDIHFISVDIYMGIKYFSLLSLLIILIIFLWNSIAVLNIFPKPNYLIQRMFEVFNLLLMIILMLLSIMPLLLGTALGATGWLGFTIICIYGLTFFVNSVNSRIKGIKKELYEENIDDTFPLVTKIWSLLKKIWITPLIFIFINIIFFRIGMWGTFSFWSFLWLFAGLIYFGILTLFVCGPMRMFVSSYYFWKYSEQFRELWKVSDKQWYGKSKKKKKEGCKK